MSVGDDTYLFVKNLQGDISKTLDDSGDVVVNYSVKSCLSSIFATFKVLESN